MTEIKPASPENIGKTIEAWNAKKEILFSRDGTAPNGQKGQDFVHNPKLKKSAEKIAALYIPVITRMIELDNQVREIEINDNALLRASEKDTMSKWKNIYNEMEILRKKSEKLIVDARTILTAEDGGLREECVNRGKITIIDEKNIANEITGSCIQFILRAIGCDQKGLIPRSPSMLPLR